MIKRFFQNSQKQFFTAADNGDIDKLRDLLNTGIDVNTSNKKGDTALVFAYASGQHKACEFLIHKGADVDNYFGQAMLMKELHNQQQGLPLLLIEKGINVNSSNKTGTSPLLLACVYGMGSLVGPLLAKGADVNKVDEDGTSCLIAAASKGYLDIVKTLVQHGADVMAENTAKMSALSQAEKKGHREIVQFLQLKRG